MQSLKARPATIEAGYNVEGENDSLVHLHAPDAVALCHDLVEGGGGVRPRLVPQQSGEAHFESGREKRGWEEMRWVRKPKGRPR